MDTDEDANNRLWHAAVDLNRENVERELAKDGVDINASFSQVGSMDWSTALYEVLTSEKSVDNQPLAVEIADILISNGANASQRMPGGLTPLHAVLRMYPGSPLLGRILEMCPNTDVNIRDDDGITPLAASIDTNESWADYNPKCWDDMLVLLKHGSDPCIPDVHGYTILHHCRHEFVVSTVLAFRGIPPMARAFDINVRNSSGETPLFCGVKWHNNECLLLLQNGADPSIPDENGDTVLHMQIKKEYMSKILNSDFRVDIDALNNVGNTPLHVHVLRDNPNGVCFLLGAGADATIPNANGFTAEDIAKRMYRDRRFAIRVVFFNHHVKLALCMGTHPRLGADSPMYDMPPELVKMLYETKR